MYTFATHLRSYPEFMAADVVSEALGLSIRQLRGHYRNRDIVAEKTSGKWVITRQSLLAQITALHVKPGVSASSLSAVPSL